MTIHRTPSKNIEINDSERAVSVNGKANIALSHYNFVHTILVYPKYLKAMFKVFLYNNAFVTDCYSFLGDRDIITVARLDPLQSALVDLLYDTKGVIIHYYYGRICIIK
jgi:hypothetical protein